MGKKRNVNINQICCDAMEAAGITDPQKQEGIDFCVNSCPYDCCMVAENPATPKQRKVEKHKRIARGLRERRVAVDDIAAILSVSERKVRGYLKK